MREEMRAQMVSTVTDLMAQDQRVTVLLGNISTTQFAETFQRFPERIYDVGILEQSMLSTAAGLALEGLIPVVHTIAPFLVERSIEQIKDDFGYQRLGGNFISIGASYDYGTSGMTHHAPGDVQVLRTVPGMQIIIPGTPGEFDRLFRQAYANAAPTYYRLSVQRNRDERAVRFGTAEVVQRGSQATVIAIGPALDRTLEAVSDLDVTVLYYTTVAPFDAETLCALASSSQIVLVEPFYEGTLTAEVVRALRDRPTRIETIGVPRQILSHYGTVEQHDAAIGFTAQDIRQRIEDFLTGGGACSPP